MNRHRWLLILPVLALVLSGCGMRTVEDMYEIPRRSSEYQSFQTAMDSAMRDMEYAAPAAGENRQSLQSEDLDGDGMAEYLVFARDTSGKSLRILVFHEADDNTFFLWDTIQATGTSFDQVVYAPVDDAPGVELIVGTQISNQVMGNVAVYSFGEGSSEQILSSSYSKLVATDLDGDDRRELLLIRQGEAEGNATAFSYDFKDGVFERSRDVTLSLRGDAVRRVVVGKLESGETAVYVSGQTQEETVVTDVLTKLSQGLVNVAGSGDMGMGFQPLLNQSVYCEDLDGDGVLEFPTPVLGVGSGFGDTGSCLIDWYSVDSGGIGTWKYTTFHDYGDGWYVALNDIWADRVTVSRERHSYTFSLRGEDGTAGTPLFSLYAFSGRDREAQAVDQNRFLIFRGENVVFAGKLESGSTLNGVTQAFITENFHLIHLETSEKGR